MPGCVTDAGASGPRAELEQLVCRRLRRVRYFEIDSDDKQRSVARAGLSCARLRARARRRRSRRDLVVDLESVGRERRAAGLRRAASRGSVARRWRVRDLGMCRRLPRMGRTGRGSADRCCGDRVDARWAWLVVRGEHDASLRSRERDRDHAGRPRNTMAASWQAPTTSSCSSRAPALTGTPRCWRAASSGPSWRHLTPEDGGPPTCGRHGAVVEEHQRAGRGQRRRSSPALAGIIGGRRAWMVSMISPGSMPCR